MYKKANISFWLRRRTEKKKEDSIWRRRVHFWQRRRKTKKRNMENSWSAFTPPAPLCPWKKHNSKRDFPLVRMNPNVDAASIIFTFQGQLYGWPCHSLTDNVTKQLRRFSIWWHQGRVQHMIAFDNIGQHEVNNDKVISSFGDKMKTCFDHNLMQYWLWPKIVQKAQTQGVNKYRLKKKVTEKLVY